MKYIIFSALVALFFCSCANNSASTLEVFRASDEGLKQSIETISTSNEMIYRSFEARSADPDYNAERIQLWKSKAEEVKLLCNAMIQYINKLKLNLKSEAGLKTDSFTKSESFKEDDINAVARLLDTKGKGFELFERLKNFKKHLFSIDPALNNEFKYYTQVFTRSFDEATSDAKIFTKTYFTGIPVIAAVAVLSKFENNVKIIENRFITYCINSTRVLIHRMSETIAPIITQNTNYVRGGGYIEIEAGIGVYATMAQPKIIIGNKIIEPEYGGLVKYRFKTSFEKGKHTLPVKFQYTKPDGTTNLITRNIEYTIVE